MVRVGTSFRSITMARGNFLVALGDVELLLARHDAETKGRPGRPDPNLEVFKRAGVILSVTAWETFIEDTLADAFDKILAAARTPNDVERTFNAVANAWLSDNPRPPQLAEWTLDGWKEMLRRQLQKDIEGLNTPNSTNIARLTKRYFGKDVTASWHWKGVSALAAQRRLDALILLRGKLVHRSKELFESASSVRRRDVSGALELLNRLTQVTEEALRR